MTEFIFLRLPPPPAAPFRHLIVQKKCGAEQRPRRFCRRWVERRKYQPCAHRVPDSGPAARPGMASLAFAGQIKGQMIHQLDSSRPVSAAAAAAAATAASAERQLAISGGRRRTVWHITQPPRGLINCGRRRRGTVAREKHRASEMNSAPS